MSKCLCDHEAHFDHRVLTPNERAGHSYRAEFSEIRPITTPYGTLQVCEDCAVDCHGDVFFERPPTDKPTDVQCELCKKHIHSDECWSIWKNGQPIFCFCTTLHMVQFMKP